MSWLRKKRDVLYVFTDGAIRPARGRSGLAAVVQDEQGRIVSWMGRLGGRLTNNEAEYEAVILALEHVQERQPASLIVFTDSRVVVDQAQGKAVARAPGLKERLARLRAVAMGMRLVEFRHIPRRRNRLADALANDVVDGFLAEGIHAG